jgi:cytochrome bd-type quinol oxidase subunit 2
MEPSTLALFWAAVRGCAILLYVVLDGFDLGVAAAARLVPKYFDPREVAVVEGAVPETTALLAQE